MLAIAQAVLLIIVFIVVDLLLRIGLNRARAERLRKEREAALEAAVRLDVSSEDPKPTELYDLSRDVGEKNNIAAEHPEIIAKIEAFIKRNRIEPSEQKEPEKPEGKRFM